jgi:phosphopantothenoylcysteine decarboxylase/phosphopantothenate--cysteine ligase
MFSTKRFHNKQILVGITGGIAAYKACELIRYLVIQGAEVRAMMTRGAEKFITELTIESLSGHPVYSEMFPQSKFTATHHIELADWTEGAIIVPATANIIGKIANGIGDDFVSTTVLALHCPVVIAPAMNSNMWNNPLVQRNVNFLEEVGYIICYPEEGFLAEGYSGVGRLARLEYLIQHLYDAIHPARDSLKGKTVLITAGRTEEYLDPVRMLSNRSTGRMGFALAWEAHARGAKTILVHGPGDLTPPVDVETHRVVSARDMYNTVQKFFPAADIFISAAAVGDYRPASYSSLKIKKGQDSLVLKLGKTYDILKEMSNIKKGHQHLVGFAVETDDPEKNARLKLKDKKLDMIVLNNPLKEGAGFAAETNKVTLISEKEVQYLDLKSKLDVAYGIFEFLLRNT